MISFLLGFRPSYAMVARGSALFPAESRWLTSMCLWFKRICIATGSSYITARWSAVYPRSSRILILSRGSFRKILKISRCWYSRAVRIGGWAFELRPLTSISYRRSRFRAIHSFPCMKVKDRAVCAHWLKRKTSRQLSLGNRPARIEAPWRANSIRQVSCLESSFCLDEWGWLTNDWCDVSHVFDNHEIISLFCYLDDLDSERGYLVTVMCDDWSGIKTSGQYL
jgi:hypothetical protein